MCIAIRQLKAIHPVRELCQHDSMVMSIVSKFQCLLYTACTPASKTLPQRLCQHLMAGPILPSILAQVASETLHHRLCQHLMAGLLLPSHAGKGCQQFIASKASPAFDGRTATATKCWHRLPARHCLRGFASIWWHDCSCHQMLAKVASETLPQMLCQHLMTGLLLPSNAGQGCQRDIAL